MKKHLIVGSIVILFSSGYVFSSKPRHYYIIAIQAQPFQIETDGKAHRRIISDIIEAAFDDSQYEINYHTYSFNRMINKLEARDNPNWVTYAALDGEISNL